MKIIGQTRATLPGQKRRDPVLDNARRKAMRQDAQRNRNANTATGFAGATDIASVALMKNQIAWAGVGEARLGVCSSPTSASFPDGKVHSGLDKL